MVWRDLCYDEEKNIREEKLRLTKNTFHKYDDVDVDEKNTFSRFTSAVEKNTYSRVFPAVEKNTLCSVSTTADEKNNDI